MSDQDNKGTGRNAFMDNPEEFLQRARATLDEAEAAVKDGKKISGFFVVSKRVEPEIQEGVAVAQSTAGVFAEDVHTNTAFRVASGIMHLPPLKLLVLTLKLAVDKGMRESVGLDVFDATSAAGEDDKTEGQSAPSAPSVKSDGDAEADDCNCPVCQIRRGLTALLPDAVQAKPKSAGPDPGAAPTEEEMNELMKIFGSGGPNSVN